MKKTVFSTYHPAVIFLYFVAVIIFTFVLLQPIYVVLALILASTYYIFLKGPKLFLLSCRLFIPILLVVALINPLFNSRGDTILFMVGYTTITAEALIYGLCSGGMLVSVLIWFSCYTEVMSNDKFLYLFGHIAPTTSLVVSMIFGFIPTLVGKSRVITDSQTALLGADAPSAKERTSLGVRMASVLVSIGMENSIETANSMRARGYGSVKHRSCYANYRWNKHDTTLLVILAVLIIISAVFACMVMDSFVFYPSITPLSFEWGYVVYALLLLVPLLLEGRVLL